MKVIIPIWLIVLIAGLGSLSVTIYSPLLMDIEVDLRTSMNNVEHTLTTYLFGFAIGIFFWGTLSDRIGRKPCLLGGLIVYLFGCISCYNADHIYTLMLSRLLQAFGCSVGSVISQSIVRDSFTGNQLSKIFSIVGVCLALFPALGTATGGLIAEYLKWRDIFLLLLLIDIILFVLAAFKIPETHKVYVVKTFSMKDVFLKIFRDPHVIRCGIIVGAGSGITYSYFAEGPFYLIKTLGLSQNDYGLSFFLMAFSSVAGGLIAKHLVATKNPTEIVKYGINIIFSAALIFSCIIFSSSFFETFNKTILIYTTIICQMFIQFGIAMIMGNVLCISLTNYSWCTGTASSLFGLFYCLIISIFNYGMGELHNGTLIPMPLYFFFISALLLYCKKGLKT